MVRGRTVLVVAMGACFAIVPLACSSGGGTSEPPPTLEPISITVITTPQSTTTTLRPIDPALVDDCVEYIKFGAFTQNPMLTALWDAADQDDQTLRVNCVSLGRDDPGALQALSDGWAVVQQALQTTSTTSTTIAVKVPRTTAPPDTEAPAVDTTPDTVPPESTTEPTVDPTATTVDPLTP